MKKFKKMTISLLLILAITVSFCSCEYVDMAKSLIDKIGGKVVDTPDTTDDITDDTLPPDNNPSDDIKDVLPEQYYKEKYEVYVLDTYEEVLAAIELLESHGSTLKRTLGFNYESDLINSKYLFLCEKKNAEPIEEGKDFFDRKMDEGGFIWYGFYDDVTCDELVSSWYYKHYRKLEFSIRGNLNGIENGPILEPDIIDAIVPSDIEFWMHGESEEGIFSDTIEYHYFKFSLSYNGVVFAEMLFASGNGSNIPPINPFLPVEYQREFLETFVVIG